MKELHHKVMVTGAGGFVGKHLVKILKEQGYPVDAFGHRELELTDPEAVRKAVRECRPEVLVNCAAISSTGYSEEHPDESMAINVDSCVTLAEVCRELGVKLFVMSSDQVYRGCELMTPLSETTENLPANVYGRHKLLMEQRVQAVNPDAVALRLAWMFEDHISERMSSSKAFSWQHEDIVSRLIDAARSGGTIKASTRELRGMSDVDEVCTNIIKAFCLPLPGGVYNFGSENLMDSYSTLLRIASYAGIPEGHIIPDDSWGRNLSMDCSKLKTFGIRFRDTETALREALK